MRWLRCGRFRLELGRPLVMGVINITPDSFSDGGRFLDPKAAISHAHRLIAEGADLLDLGAESSRPGATPVPLEDELRRLAPVLHELRDFPIPVSVDTYKPEVMRAALAGGAAMINDIFGFRVDGAIDVVAASDCALCIMHMQGNPLTMQIAPEYREVVADVTGFLRQRAEILIAAGAARERLVVDPGFGFGKTLVQNYALLRRLDELNAIGLPILVGLSRKRMIAEITEKPSGDRMVASVVAAIEAARRGARILRVHDVAATVAAVKVWSAINAEPESD